MDAVETIAARAAHIGPRCGRATVVAIDGPAGSGKTTLAVGLVQRTGAQMVHMDDVYPGWEGLREGGEVITRLLTTIAAGQEATYRRFDWQAMAHAEQRSLKPHGLIVIEGVGSVRTDHLEYLSLIVVVNEPDPAERLRRGLRRDGAHAKAQWEAWMVQEAALHQEVGLADLAHITVDGHGRIV